MDGFFPSFVHSFPGRICKQFIDHLDQFHEHQSESSNDQTSPDGQNSIPASSADQEDKGVKMVESPVHSNHVCEKPKKKHE